MKPIVQHWLDTVANVRKHGETGRRPVDMFAEEEQSLQPLPIEPYDIGVVKQVRASRQFRVTIDTNRYSVPAQLAGVGLTVKLYPDRLCFYHENKLVARHVRSYDRRQDYEHPDHPKVLLAQRRKARDQKIFMRFLSLSGKAQEYYRQMENRRMNPFHHIRQIVALAEIYPSEEVTRAIEDAFHFKAFSCDYIANLLERRSRKVKEPAALHLTRQSDLLDLTINEPDLSIYDMGGEK
jgi:hypothetical protein